MQANQEMSRAYDKIRLIVLPESLNRIAKLRLSHCSSIFKFSSAIKARRLDSIYAGDVYTYTCFANFRFLKEG